MLVLPETAAKEQQNRLAPGSGGERCLLSHLSFAGFVCDLSFLKVTSPTSKGELHLHCSTPNAGDEQSPGS